ncbi:DUF6415 family natural product biosynthesis protein [Streptomyces sp. HNM0663]|uniref:DUF6415 family natural product biosynthesis protein n=1 Tax=Streptomyces chengmaiensis TaxID=3040919 RepID=A0ABT6HM49_9ACTN|nr:DUF6415 family natural product biosynthesis protein [Streptomyces chengmaiensis]MDH2389431.1 DUF6415 family natural product biosynthesis protein [Streptomyces chengmaiensis]
MSPAPSPARLDVEGMRTDAAQLLAPDADAPADDGLSELTLRLRGHIMQLIPALGDGIAVHPRNDDTLADAIAGVARAHRRLAVEAPNGSLTQAVAYAQGLARTVVELTEHLAALEAGR